MKKFRLLNLLTSLVFVPPLVLLTIPLSSCSVVFPYFNVSDQTVQCLKDAPCNISANWQGYYYDDVLIPSTDVGTIDFHNMTDYVILKDSHKNKDAAKNEESISLDFQIIQTLPRNSPSFDVDIYWEIKHSSFEKKTTIHFTAMEDKLKINRVFNSSSVPTDIPGYYPDDPKNWVVGDHGNTIGVIDDLYITGVDPSDEELSRVTTNLQNDFIYWQKLSLGNMQHINVDENGFMKISVDMDATSYQFSVNCVYDPTSGVFDFISMHVDAYAKYHSLFGTKDANFHLDFVWGKDTSLTNEWFDAGTYEGTYTGPKLLGAYTCINPEDVKEEYRHISQSGVKYHQNFLSLVPSDTNALQLFNFRVTESNASHDDQDTLVSSFYHSYFLQQTRMLGLEYQSGTNHLFDLDSMPLFGYDRYTGFFDSFKNWGLVLPSYYLSGVRYSDGDYKQTYAIPTIAQCKINIKDKLSTDNFKITNRIKNADGTNTDPVGFGDNWLQSYENISSEKLDMPTDDGLFTEWSTSYDNQKQTPISTHDFIASKLAEQQTNVSCIDQWNNMTASVGTSTIKDDIPWYQIIQQRAPSLRGSSLATYSDLSDNNSWDWATGKDGSNHRLPKKHFVWDSTNNKFTSFCFGLNYMFTADGMVNKQDNLFAYNNPGAINFTQP